MKSFSLTSLSIHPRLDSVPRLPSDHPIVQRINKSVWENGILHPLHICKGTLLIVDGRLRFEAAKIVGLESVECIEVPEDRIGTHIVHSLLARVHLTESGKAYIFSGAKALLDAALAESHRRRIEHLRSGKRTIERTLSLGAESFEELLEHLGVSRTMFDRAKNIRAKFAAYPAMKAKLEPEIFSGDMSLNAVTNALSGMIAGEEGNTIPKQDDRQLLLDLFSAADRRFGRLEKLSWEVRNEALDKFDTEFLPNVPDDFHARWKRFYDAKFPKR